MLNGTGAACRKQWFLAEDLLAVLAKVVMNYAGMIGTGGRKMNLLLSSILWEQQCKAGLSQLRLIDWAAELQVAGVEFRPFWLEPEAEPEQAAVLLRQAGLTAVYAANEGLLAVNQAETVRALAGLRRSLAIAMRLGARVLRMNVAAGPFDVSLLQTDWWLCSMRQILAEAKAASILLAVENGPDKARSDPAVLLALLDRIASPHFQLTFDMANWLYAGIEPQQALKQFGSRVGYVHLKDAVFSQRSLTHSHPGIGLVDVRGLYRQLLADGYTGFAALEFPGGDAPLARARQVCDYLYTD
ncbi:MAG: sugar phosphate isomerase/epimerase [Sporomusaceae bacterium]|nr:sugar phosphate isomerase/epimerase [Sporomusaceae bacterium]